MPTKGSVTQWLDQAQAGNDDAAQQLWQRYFGRLVNLARVKLRAAPCGVADAEDVALSAFDSFYKGVTRGRFPCLNDRENLWSLLVVITARKASNLRRDQTRQKRGGKNSDEQLSQKNTVDLADVIGREPSPQFAAEVAEEFQILLGTLPHETLRTIALLKMEGWTNAEIAEKLQCAPRSVERKLALIRAHWEKENRS